MHPNGMEVDGVSDGLKSSRHNAVVHSPVEAPFCPACQKNDPPLFNPKCVDCMSLFRDPNTTASEMFAILRQWTPQTQQNVEVIIFQMLKIGVFVDDRDGLTDMTMLHYACKSGARGIGSTDEAARTVKLLLEHGADPYIRCRWTNMAAIHYAVYFDVAPVVSLLLQATKGVDVDSPCSEFDMGTPLHVAARNLAVDSAQVLLQHGAFPFSKDLTGRLPIDLVPDPSAFEPESETAHLASHMRKFLEDAEPSSTCIQLGNNDALQACDDEVQRALNSIGVRLGDRVVVGGMKAGVLRFCGRTVFASGLWAGIELDEAAGKNNGSVEGIPYFHCPPNYGIFAPLSKIARTGSLSTTPSRGSVPKLNHGKVAVSHVTAKVDTGLKLARGSLSLATTDDLHVGDQVLVAGKRVGVVRFIGMTEFAPGMWFGIELEKPVGKNDGSVNGKQYFTCQPNYGVFAPPSRVQKFMDHDGHAANAEVSILSASSGNLSRRLSAESSTSQQNIHLMSKKILARSKTIGGLGAAPAGVTSSGELKLVEGMNVFCSGEMGVIRYMGPVDFADGVWIGVELKTPKGKHDGSVQGRRYFTCKPGHGLLVRPARVSVRGISGAHLLD